MQNHKKINRELSRMHRSPAILLFEAIMTLEKLPGYDDIVTKLSSELEALLLNIKPSKNCIALDGLYYYENGVVKCDQGNANKTKGTILLSPWKHTKSKSSKTMQRKYDVLGLKNVLADNINSLFAFQLKIKEGVAFSQSEKFNFYKTLKMIDVSVILGESDPNFFNIYIYDFFEEIVNIARLFIMYPYGNDIQLPFLLSNDSMDNVIKVFIQSNNWRTADSISSYISTLTAEDNFPIESEILEAVNEIIRLNEEISSELWNSQHQHNIFEIIEMPIYKCVVKLYDLLSKTKNDELKKICLKLNIINSEYTPMCLRDIANENVVDHVMNDEALIS